jgi:acyl carrier protein phosphodiesterase
MNYLAHLYLSHNDHDLMMGNLAADVVKGSVYTQFPERVQDGIRLHRAIDTFTDSHASVRAMMDLVRPAAGRYAGPIVDILCDHLLAHHWKNWCETPIRLWTTDVYQQLSHRLAELPEPLPERIARLIHYDWLMGYDQRHELEFVLSRFNQRLREPVDIAHLSSLFFGENYHLFHNHFSDFFPEIFVHTQSFALKTEG